MFEGHTIVIVLSFENPYGGRPRTEPEENEPLGRNAHCTARAPVVIIIIFSAYLSRTFFSFVQPPEKHQRPVFRAPHIGSVSKIAVFPHRTTRGSRLFFVAGTGSLLRFRAHEF